LVPFFWLGCDFGHKNKADFYHNLVLALVAPKNNLNRIKALQIIPVFAVSQPQLEGVKGEGKGEDEG
jgi:hypothetical protein